MPERAGDLIERCQGFVEYLRACDFSIGVDRALRIQRVLCRVGGDLDPSRLGAVLAPLVTTSPDEQRRFHELFAAYYPFLCESPHEEKTDSPDTKDDTKRLPGRRRRIQALVAAGLVVVSLGTAWTVRHFRPPETETNPGPNVETPLPVPTPGPNSAAVAFASLPAAQPRDSAVVQQASRSPWTDVAFVLSPAALLLAALGVRSVQRRLRSARTDTDSPADQSEPPYTVPIHIVAEPPSVYSAVDLRTAALRLRRRQYADGLRLLVDQTVTATIEASRFPTLRYERATRPPEYLFLIARASLSDHQARLFDDLARALALQGVFVARYFYDGDPSVCYAAGDRFTDRDPRRVAEQREQPGISLAELHRVHIGWRLFLCSDGSELVDALRGNLTPTARRLAEWPERAVLTPTPIASWGHRERALDAQFVVRPATLAGLQSSVERFDAIVPSDVRDLIHLPHGESPAVQPIDDVRLSELHGELGETTFRWLCACALYPELHWDLTLALGRLPELGNDVVTEETALRLVRLAWFRQGWIPDDVRPALIGYLTRVDQAAERAARRKVIDLLRVNLAPEGSAARKRQDVALVAQRVALSTDNPREHRDALRDARAVDRGELLDDAVALRELRSAAPSPLPAWISARLYQDGLRALGMTAVARTLLVILLITTAMLTAWLTLPGLRQRPATPVVSNVAMLVPNFERVELWPNDTVRLDVTALDSNNIVIAAPGQRTWTIELRPTALASIDTSGLLRAGSPLRSDSTFASVTVGGRVAKTLVVVDAPVDSTRGALLQIGTPRAAAIGDTIQMPLRSTTTPTETRDNSRCAGPVVRWLNGDRALALNAGRVSVNTIAPAGVRDVRRSETLVVRMARDTATCNVDTRPPAFDSVLAAALPPVGTSRGVTIRVGETYDVGCSVLPCPNLPPDFNARLRAGARFRSTNPAVASIVGLGRVRGQRPGRAAVELTQVGRDGYLWRQPITVIDTQRVVTRLDSILRGSRALPTQVLRVTESVDLPQVLGVSRAQLMAGRITFTSDRSDVAAVTADGVVTGVQPGSSMILMRRDSLSVLITVLVRDAERQPANLGTRVVAVGDTILLNTQAQNAAARAQNAAPQAQNAAPPGGTYTSQNESIARVVGRGRVLGVAPGSTRVTYADSVSPAYWLINVVPRADSGSDEIVAQARAAIDRLNKSWSLLPVPRATVLSSMRPGTYGFTVLVDLVTSKLAQRVFPTQQDARSIEVLYRDKSSRPEVLGFTTPREILSVGTTRVITLRPAPTATAYCPVVVQIDQAEFTVEISGGLAVSARFRSRATLPRMPSEVGVERPFSSCLARASVR